MEYIPFKQSNNNWLFQSDFEQFKKHVKLELRINDNMDVCAKIQQLPQQDSDDSAEQYIEELKTVYFIEKCGQGIDQNVFTHKKMEEPYNYQLFEQIEKFKQEADEVDPKTGKLAHISCRVYSCLGHEKFKFQFNNSYLFLHNRYKINFFDFNKNFVESNQKTIGLEVGLDEEVAFIKEIRMCTNKNRIAIVVNENKEDDNIFLWNIESNLEKMMLDVQGEFKIIWDNMGQMYILTNESVFFTNILCTIKAFDYQQFD